MEKTATIKLSPVSKIRFIIPYTIQSTGLMVKRSSKQVSPNIVDEVIDSLQIHGDSIYEIANKPDKQELLPFINDVLSLGHSNEGKQGHGAPPQPGSKNDNGSEPQLMRQAAIIKVKDGKRQSTYGNGFVCAVKMKNKTAEKEIPFKIDSIESYIFRSNVGFLIYDIALKEDASLDDVLEISDYLKRFQAGYKKSFTITKKKQEGLESIEINLSDMVEALLASLETSLFRHHVIKRKSLVSTALVYSYLHLYDDTGKKIEFTDIKDYLYWLRYVHKKDHLPAPDELQLENNPTLYQSYENVMFGFSTEGGTLVTLERGQGFISRQFADRALSNYFYLYMLVLHQVYATHHFTIQVSERMPVKDKKGRMQDGLLKTLRYDILFFLLNSWFPQVSTRLNYNKVYEHWREVFRTEEIFRELKSEVDELDEHFNKISQRRQEWILNILTVWLVPLGLLFGFWGVNFTDLLGNSILGPIPLISVFLIVITIVIIHKKMNQ